MTSKQARRPSQIWRGPSVGLCLLAERARPGSRMRMAGGPSPRMREIACAWGQPEGPSGSASAGCLWTGRGDRGQERGRTWDCDWQMRDGRLGRIGLGAMPAEHDLGSLLRQAKPGSGWFDPIFVFVSVLDRLAFCFACPLEGQTHCTTTDANKFMLHKKDRAAGRITRISKLVQHAP